MYCDFHEIHLIIYCPVYFIWSWFTWYFFKRRPYTYELVVPKMILANMSYLLKEHILSTRLLFYSRLHLKLRKNPFIEDLYQVYKHRTGMSLTCAFYVQCIGKFGLCIQSSYIGFPWHIGYPSPVTCWQFHTQ